MPISRVFETLSVYMGSAFVNDFNILGRTYRVTAQADNPFRLTLRDVSQLKTRNIDGDMVPIGAVANFTDTTGPYRVPRYNLFPAAEVQVGLARGFSSGQGLEALEKIAAEKLPSGFGFEWTEIALQEKLAGNTAIVAFGLAVVFVFLLLSALYESWLLPLAVILIVPMCILAAMIGVNFRGLDRNVLVEIGLVVLVGLAAKNAILIVEFAKQAEEEGKTRFEAAVDAARTRLRPILMTSLAFILGVVPLVLATGAGAEMRQSLGTAVFSGMIGVTLFGLIFTPVFYVLCRGAGPAAASAKPRSRCLPVPRMRREPFSGAFGDIRALQHDGPAEWRNCGQIGLRLPAQFPDIGAAGLGSRVRAGEFTPSDRDARAPSRLAGLSGSAASSGRGGIGRHARFRFWWRKSWGFKSLRPHQ